MCQYVYAEFLDEKLLLFQLWFARWPHNIVMQFCDQSEFCMLIEYNSASLYSTIINRVCQDNKNQHFNWYLVTVALQSYISIVAYWHDCLSLDQWILLLSGGILFVLGWIITVHDESIKFLGLLKVFGSSFITAKFLFVLRISIVEMDLNIDESQVAK